MKKILTVLLSSMLCFHSFAPVYAMENASDETEEVDETLPSEEKTVNETDPLPEEEYAALELRFKADEHHLWVDEDDPENEKKSKKNGQKVPGGG